MFKANRVGTPYFWSDQNIIRQDAIAFAQEPVVKTGTNQAQWTFNTASAVAIPEFGGLMFVYDSTGNVLASGQRMGIGIPIGVIKPLAGRAVGIELTGYFVGVMPRHLIVAPYFGRIDALGVPAVGDPLELYNPTQIDGHNEPGDVSDVLQAINLSVRTQVVLSALNSGSPAPGGTYGFVFFIMNGDADPEPIGRFQCAFHVRQQQELLTVGYNDPVGP